MRDHGATSTTVETPPAPTAAFTWRRPSRSRPCSTSPSAATSSSCSPVCSASSDDLEPQLERRRRQLGELRRRARRAAAPGRRSARAASPSGATRRRRRAAPRARPSSAAAPRVPAVRAGGRAAPRALAGASARCRPLPGTRASRARASAGRRRRDPPVLLAPRQAPGAPAVRPQSFGHGATRQPGKLSDRANSRAPPAPRSGSRSSGSSVSGSGARNERVRSSETISACPGRATFAAASAANRRSAAPARGVPDRPDRGERPLERRLEPAVEPLDALRLEVDRARLGRLDREARVLEPAQDLLPRLLDRGRVLLDELELRARRERLPEPHPRPHALRLRRPGHRADQRLRPGQRRERRRLRLRAAAGGAARPADRRPG